MHNPYHPQLECDLWNKWEAEQARLTRRLLLKALPYTQHKSNCALMTMLPTADPRNFSCTCGFEGLRALTAESEALGLYD